jgi:hypothetical protein
VKDTNIVRDAVRYWRTASDCQAIGSLEVFLEMALESKDYHQTIRRQLEHAANQWRAKHETSSR